MAVLDDLSGFDFEPLNKTEGAYILKSLDNREEAVTKTGIQSTREGFRSTSVVAWSWC